MSGLLIILRDPLANLARSHSDNGVICGVVIWLFPNTQYLEFALLDLRPGPPTVL